MPRGWLLMRLDSSDLTNSIHHRAGAEMSEQLERLRAKYCAQFERCKTHEFNSELCNGTLADSRLFVYLFMDLKFFLGSVRMLAQTASQCDNDKALVRLGLQVGELCKDENEYFARTLAELRHSLAARLEARGEPGTLPEVEEYIRFLEDPSRSYAENIAAFYVLELVYLMWANTASADYATRLPYKHSEWIRLHSGPAFEEWVTFLESEVIRVLDASTVDRIDAVMRRVVDLEVKFFDSCYNCEW